MHYIPLSGGILPQLILAGLLFLCSCPVYDCHRRFDLRLFVIYALCPLVLPLFLGFSAAAEIGRESQGWVQLS